MSRCAKARTFSREWLFACALALPCTCGHAQTIADYSRAQRMLLEATMIQAAARSSAVGGSMPPASSSFAAAAAAAVVPATLTPRLPSATFAASLTPAVQVSGVFAAGGTAVAEVVVSGTRYLLQAGQGVPGTAWRVESIAIDRVVLCRPGGRAAGDTEGARKVFSLPASR